MKKKPIIEYPTLAAIRSAEGSIRLVGETDPTQLIQWTTTGEICPEGIGLCDPLPIEAAKADD